MTSFQKPPLNEDLLIHFGIKGMKWGVRKQRETDASVDDGSTTITITGRQKTLATAALGSAVVGGALYYTGNLGTAAVVSTSLAVNGAKIASRVLVTSGSILAKTTYGVGKAGAKVSYQVGSEVAAVAATVASKVARVSANVVGEAFWKSGQWGRGAVFQRPRLRRKG